MKRTYVVALAALLLGSGAARAGETITYEYDALGRVVKVAHNGTVNDKLQSNYRYDRASNRSNVTVTGVRKVIVVPLNGLSVMIVS